MLFFSAILPFEKADAMKSYTNPKRFGTIGPDVAASVPAMSREDL
jgi:hypothetical protein